ncbi:ewing's tumor-associated antigen 1 isoform X2 [Marmota marmota marmota]|uniref:ewing's tumor-associated antigen 1 isoform X2 n=1 Tax=Marmota marmota marmota TaxID=9994 RepID=UPI00209245B6|nr:ewing's tumor-associated antigen 1 isoform X2 [Marmota marmota marmota]
MSRRRKYGDSSAPKNTPRRTAATEDCSSVVEPGSRRLKSARGHETPQRVLKMDLFSCTFSSPNDPDGQNDIFWDQNSPMTKQLGKGRKKKIYTTGSDEISDIVNRIAPQDEKKPTTNSMLGMWIGAAAIPCTPSVAQKKSRIKVSRTKLKTQYREKELMKLAEQFDKNMEELDVAQEQNKKNHDFIQEISKAETSHSCNDYVQMHPLHDVVPIIDNTIIKKPMKGNTRISVANDQSSSQKPFDQNAEAAFNALFDDSTQKCSGQLSQDLADAFLNTRKNALKEEKIIINGTLVTEKLPGKTQDSLYPQVDPSIMTKSCMTPYSKEPEASSKPIGTFTTSDLEDDWEKLLSNEPFVMQNVEAELFPSKTAQVTDHKGIYTFTSEYGGSTSRTNKSLDAKLGDSEVLQDLPSKTHNRELIDAGKYIFSSNPNDKSSKLSSTRNKMKSSSKIVSQDKTQDCAVTSNLTKVKEDICINFTSNVNTSEKKSALNTKHSSEQKNKPIFDPSFKAPVNIDPFGSSTLDCETVVNKPDQTNASKLGSFFDDWNEPSLANEIFETCHRLETSWETDNVDDDLLYQACDDIERLTQQQDILKDNKTSESILEINDSSKHGAKNISTTSKQGSQLAQSNHLNLGSITVQTSSLTVGTQINKSVKMEKREMSGNSSEFWGTTTNLTMYSKNSNCQNNNLHVYRNNSDVLMQVPSSKSVFAGSSSLNVNSNYVSPVIASNKKKLITQQLSHRPQTDEAQSEFNKAVRFSKYTFAKTKNPQILYQLNQNCIETSMSTTKITQGLEKKKTVNSITGEADQQMSLVKISESLKQSSKEEEEKNRKYSPEEIQRKRQEALVRRMAKAQASSVNSAPT